MRPNIIFGCRCLTLYTVDTTFDKFLILHCHELVLPYTVEMMLVFFFPYTVHLIQCHTHIVLYLDVLWTLTTPVFKFLQRLMINL